MATVTISKHNIKTKTNIFAAVKKTLKNAEAPLLYHRMKRLSGNGFTLVVVYAKQKIRHQKKLMNMKKQIEGSKSMDIITTSVMNPGQGTSIICVIN